MKNKKKYSLSKILINFFFIILCFVFLLPIVTIISISLSDEIDIVNFGYKLIPIKISLDAYKFVFKNPTQILDAYKITIIISIIGTFISLFIAMMCSYALSRKTFKYGRYISLYLLFAMLFSGGMIPKYILVTQYLHLQDTILILILDTLIAPLNIFILRTFIKEIAESIIESAYIDGASEFKILISIIIPISKPAIATIGLLTLLNYWNNWNTALLYINDEALYTLQYLLQKILRDIDAILKAMDNGSGLSIGLSVRDLPTESARMAMAVVAAGPMLFIMPFFQKYFTRGLQLGSVKG